MSISITTKPNAVDFSGNGLKYKIATGYVVTAPVKAKFYFKKIGTLQEWEGFIVPIPGTTTLISCSAIGITYGWPNSIRYGVSIENTIIDLRNIYLIDKYYDVYLVDTDKIYFEAKEGIEIDSTLIDFISEEVSPGYEFVDPTYVISEGVTGVYLDDFSVVAKLHYQDNEICELKLDADIDGSCELEAGKFLPRNIIEKGSIAYGLSEVTALFDFKVGFSENVGGSIYHILFDELKALPGKIPFRDYPDFDPSIPIFLTSSKKFDSYEDAFHKLTFFPGSTHSSYYITMVLYKIDGTTSNVGMAPNSYDFLQMNFFISNLTSSDPDVYKIGISSSISGTETILIFIKEKRFFDRQFLFKNTYGFWETMICSGNIKQTTNTERELFKTHLAAGYTADEGEYTTEVRKQWQQFEVETGWKESQEIDQIIEALKSRELYEIDGTDYIKCEILNTETEVKNDEEDVKNIVITYRHSFDD